MSDAPVPPPAPPPPPAPTPTPPPAGTTRTTFFQSSGFKVAVVSTIVALNAIFVRPWLTAHFGETNAMLVEIAEWSWAAAFGIQRTDTSSLRQT